MDPLSLKRQKSIKDRSLIPRHSIAGTSFMDSTPAFVDGFDGIGYAGSPNHFVTFIF